MRGIFQRGNSAPWSTDPTWHGDRSLYTSVPGVGSRSSLSASGHHDFSWVSVGAFLFSLPQSIADPCRLRQVYNRVEKREKKSSAILIRTSFAPLHSVAPAPASLPVAKRVSILLFEASRLNCSTFQRVFTRRYWSVLFIHMASIVKLPADDPRALP